jgi:hypothetical protein
MMHRDIGLHAGFVQHFLGFQIPAICGTHCEPDHRFSVRHTSLALTSSQ